MIVAGAILATSCHTNAAALAEEFMLEPAPAEMRILLWNVAWATPQSRRGTLIRARITRMRPDVVCLTEGYEGFMGRGWSTLSGGLDPGYPLVPGRRKVLLSARRPWCRVECTPPLGFSAGRFVRAKVRLAVGPIWFVALCIPWSHAHVNHGRKDRAPWEEHMVTLEALERFLAGRKFDAPVIVLGDFNQRIPHARSPRACYQKLTEVLRDRYDVVTAGNVLPDGRRSIDHVCLGEELTGRVVRILRGVARDGTHLSDHCGLVVDVDRAIASRHSQRHSPL